MTDETVERYAALLASFVDAGAEEDLSSAYELGRSLLVEGAGLGDVTALHHEALARRLAAGATPEAARHLVPRAAAFLVEVLGPFEMAHRGFREANQALLSKNDELQRSRDALASANEELEAFSYSVAHDLRAPLRRIDGFSQVLVEDHAEKLGADGRHQLARVRAGAQRMGELIDDLLRLSRIGRSAVERVDVDVSALATEIAQGLVDAGGVDIRVQPHLAARADANLVRILFENLLANAVKFSAKQEAPVVEVGEESGDLFVRDNGVGFDPQRARLMFAPFQRFHDASAYPGTGIGLAIVQRIVKLHGGKLRATSSPGAGATFSFTLGGAARG